MSEETDTALATRAAKGDRMAFHALVVRYEKCVFNLAFRMLSDREEAKDVTQTAFLKAYENLARYDPAHRFFSWIYRIAVNETIDHAKRRKRLVTVEEVRMDQRGNPETETQSEQTTSRVQQALEELKPDHQAVIILKHLQGCSYRDISEILGIPEKTVKSRLYTARQKLLELLKEEQYV